MATYTAGCSKVGSFSYAQYFTLYVILNERDINSATNTSVVDYNVYCQSSGSGSINAKHFLYFNLGGNVFRNETVQVNVSSPNAYIGIASGSITVTHDSSGNYALGFSAQIAASSYGVSASINNTFNCATIPRYTTVYNSARSKTIDSISVNWSTTDARDWTQYSLNGGGWTNANDTVASDNKSGYYTISGLSPNTAYTVKTRCRRADSQLWSEAGAITISTYHHGLVSGASNFNDEQNPTISYTNAFGNGVGKLEACISVTGATDDVKYREISKTGTSYTFNLTEDERNVLRKKATGNSLAVAFFVRTTYNGKTYHSSWGVIMSIVNANPTFTNWSYEDTNSRIVELTGNNQIVVKGYSTVRGVVTTANKAIAKKQASITKYQLNIGGGIKEREYSSSSTVYTDSILANTNTFTMYAIDSRTNSTAVQKTLDTSKYKQYSDISIDTSKTNATRLNKIGSQTTLNVEGKIWNNSFGNTFNAIDTFTVEYKLTNQTDENYKLITVDKPTLSGNTFKLNTSIRGDLEADGFTVTSSFNIRVKISDLLSTSTYVMTLSSGTPNIAVHKNGVAINKPYDTSQGGALQVNGTANINGKLSTTELVMSRSFWYKLDALGNSDVNGRCYKIAKIPATGDGNACVLNIKGAIGGWGAEKATIDAQITNRNGLAVYLNYLGNSKAFDYQRLLIYLESDGSHSVYIKALANYPGPLSLNVTWGYSGNTKVTIYTDYSYTKSPTGTLAYESVKQAIQNVNGGTIIYDNASGTRNAVTLTENASNFTHLDIFYYGNSSCNHCKRVQPGKSSSLIDCFPVVNDKIIQTGVEEITVSGTSITRRSKVWFNFYGGSNSVDGGVAESMAIYKVVGYR